MTKLEDEVAELRKQVADLTAAVRRLTPRESAWVPPHASVGENVKLAAGVVLSCNEDRPITIGPRTNIYRGTEITGPVSIGEGCLINRDGYIRPGTVIGDRVFMGPFVRLITDGHEMGGPDQRAGANAAPPINIGDGTWIGAGVTVVGGVTIGRGCMVAAGAVVVSDIPDNMLVGGVPARVIRSLI